MNKKIKNLMIKSAAGLLATMTLSGCGISNKPKETAMISSSPMAIETLEPTPIATPEPTVDPYDLTENEVKNMAQEIWADNLFFFENPELVNYVFKMPYNIYDLENMICYANGYTAINPEKETLSVGGNPGASDLHSLSVLCMGLENAEKLAESKGIPNYEDYAMKFSNWFKEGTYEHEVLKKLEDDLLFITSNNATEEEKNQHWGDVINMLSEKEIDGHVVLNEVSLRAKGFVVFMCFSAFRYYTRYAQTADFTIPAFYIDENLKNTELGNEQLFVIAAFMHEPYQGDNEKIQYLYDEIFQMATGKLDAWSDDLMEEAMSTHDYSKKISK